MSGRAARGGRTVGPFAAASVFLTVGVLSALAPASVSPAQAATVHVRSSGQFASAVAGLRDSGGTIVLHSARYGDLVVGPRAARPLRIRAASGASVGRLRLDRTQAVTLVGLRVRPRVQSGGIDVVGSRGIRIEDAIVTAVGTDLGANIRLTGSLGVTVTNSRLSHCGESVGGCIETSGSSAVKIIGNRFHDCRGCDFIQGSFGTNMVIRSNRFDRSLYGRCRDACGHPDLIELWAGRRLVIERNRFGVWEAPGGGQVALFGPVDDVQIRNNVFLRTDPRAPQIIAHVAINLGGFTGLPKQVVISHNTILAGHLHPRRGFASSIRFKGSYRFVPRPLRPVLANNFIRLVRTPEIVCRSARLSVANVIRHGVPCSSRDVVGDVQLNERGQPTAGSALLIDRAAARWSTPRDIRGFRRVGPPDIGAYEYGAIRG